MSRARKNSLVAAKAALKAAPGVGSSASESVQIWKTRMAESRKKRKQRDYAGAAADALSANLGAQLHFSAGMIKAGSEALLNTTTGPRRFAANYPMWATYAYGNPAPVPHLLQECLAHLRALQWVYWTTHWTSEGPNFYSDHLMLQRLYESEDDDGSGGPDINAQIDGLGERMVAMFGPGSVNPAQINGRVQELVQVASDNAEGPLHALLQLENSFQAVCRSAWEVNKQMSLGLDNFLAGLADDRTTAQYLLMRRLGVGARSNPRRNPRSPNNAMTGPERFGLVPIDMVFGVVRQRKNRKSVLSGELVQDSRGNIYIFALTDEFGRPVLAEDAAEYKQLMKELKIDRRKHASGNPSMSARAAAKKNPRPGPFLKPPGGWPVGDIRHAKLALQYMAAGRGRPSEYPILLERLAQVYPPTIATKASKEIWHDTYQRLRPKIAAHIAKAM